MANNGCLDDKTYVEEIKRLHKFLHQEDVANHSEVQIRLPRSLQGQRTARTVAKIVELSTKLKEEDRSNVTATVAGNNLIMKTFSEKGKTPTRTQAATYRTGEKAASSQPTEVIKPVLCRSTDAQRVRITRRFLGKSPTSLYMS